VELAAPAVYQLACYGESLPTDCSWQGEITLQQNGQINALRFITKNVIAIDEAAQRTVDWFSQYLIVPLDEPLTVAAGQQVAVSFTYQPGDRISALKPSITMLR